MFSGGVYPLSATSRTLSLSISNSFWYDFDSFFRWEEERCSQTFDGLFGSLITFRTIWERQNEECDFYKECDFLATLSFYRLSETKEIRTLVHYPLATLKKFLLVAKLPWKFFPYLRLRMCAAGHLFLLCIDKWWFSFFALETDINPCHVPFNTFHFCWTLDRWSVNRGGATGTNATRSVTTRSRVELGFSCGAGGERGGSGADRTSKRRGRRRSPSSPSESSSSSNEVSSRFSRSSSPFIIIVVVVRLGAWAEDPGRNPNKMSVFLPCILCVVLRSAQPDWEGAWFYPGRLIERERDR